MVGIRVSFLGSGLLSGDMSSFREGTSSILDLGFDHHVPHPYPKSAAGETCIARPHVDGWPALFPLPSPGPED